MQGPQHNTKLIGVQKQQNKYRAKYSRICLGTFITAEEAAKTYDKAAIVICRTTRRKPRLNFAAEEYPPAELALMEQHVAQWSQQHQQRSQRRKQTGASCRSKTRVFEPRIRYAKLPAVRFSLGTYQSAREASAAYDIAKILLYGAGCPASVQGLNHEWEDQADVMAHPLAGKVCKQLLKKLGAAPGPATLDSFRQAMQQYKHQQPPQQQQEQQPDQQQQQDATVAQAHESGAGCAPITPQPAERLPSTQQPQRQVRRQHIQAAAQVSTRPAPCLVSTPPQYADKSAAQQLQRRDELETVQQCKHATQVIQGHTRSISSKEPATRQQQQQTTRGDEVAQQCEVGSYTEAELSAALQQMDAAHASMQAIQLDIAALSAHQTAAELRLAAAEAQRQAALQHQAAAAGHASQAMAAQLLSVAGEARAAACYMEDTSKRIAAAQAKLAAAELAKQAAAARVRVAVARAQQSVERG